MCRWRTCPSAPSWTNISPYSTFKRQSHRYLYFLNTHFYFCSKNAKFFSSDFHEGLLLYVPNEALVLHWERNIQRFFHFLSLCSASGSVSGFRIETLGDPLTHLDHRIRWCVIFTYIGSNHRVPTPPPPPLREGRQVEISWTRKLPTSSPRG